MSFDTREQRDEIVKQLYEIDKRRYPEDRLKKPKREEDNQLREQYYLKLGEYADRLPRIRLSHCPYCEKPLKKVFDPFGLDGHWWHITQTVEYEESNECEHFMVLLGALFLNGRTPSEAVQEVQPGPEVPFVIPTLLRIPGMVAVISDIKIETGDRAYPIAYFSNHKVHPKYLHQSWCRDTHWFDDDTGGQSWTIANYAFDFDLLPYVKRKQLQWVNLDDKNVKVLTVDDGPCPYIDLPGDRERQVISFGERDLIGLPTGEPINPFE